MSQVIDAHMHVYPVSAWGEQRTHDHAIREYGGAEVDYPTGTAGTVDEVLEAVRVADLSYAIALNLFEPDRWRFDIADSGLNLSTALRAAASPGEYLVALNRWLVSATGAWPHLLPVIAIDPAALHPNQLADHVEYLVREHGVAGVKLHPILQRAWPSDPRLGGVWELCADLEVPAIIHSGIAGAGPQFAGPSAFERLATSFPRLTVVVAHLGGAAWREIAALSQAPSTALVRLQ